MSAFPRFGQHPYIRYSPSFAQKPSTVYPRPMIPYNKTENSYSQNARANFQGRPQFKHSVEDTSQHYKKEKYEYNQNPSDTRNKDDVKTIELLGLKLYLDDILIIGILFFLYQEGIQDPELFITLILLLIS